jgi:hypothetical protein
MTFFDSPAGGWTGEAIASHYYYGRKNAQVFHSIKKDLSERAAKDDPDARLAKQFLSNWKVRFAVR